MAGQLGSYPTPPPPSILMARRGFYFYIKKPETDFDNFFLSKIVLFFGKYCNNPDEIPNDKF